MKLTIEPTSALVFVRAAPEDLLCRVWEGADENGVPVRLLVATVAVHKDQPADVHERFANELMTAQDARAAVDSWPARMFIG